MRSLIFALVLCTGCALFEPGPLGEPSPATVAVATAKESYDSNPLKDYGPYGAVAAAAIALFVGGKKGYAAYKAKRALPR